MTQTPSPTLGWASGLAIGGGALILVVGLAGAAVLYGLANLAWFSDYYHTYVDPHAGPVDAGTAVLSVLVAVWTVLSGGTALVAGLALRRSPHALGWGVTALVAAVASLPVTGGLGFGALMVGVGAVLAMLVPLSGQPAAAPPG